MTTSPLVRFSSGSVVIFLLLITGAVRAHAAGGSVVIQSISPTGAISPGTMVNFSVSASGFTDPVYSVSDPFTVPGATVGTIDKVGFFAWTPGVYDAGRHNITVTVTDAFSHAASTTVSIIVASNTVIISVLSPGSTVTVRRPLTFTVAAPGFVTPQYSVYDSSMASTLNNSNINTSGAFSWTPTPDDLGSHLLTINASDLYGHNAQATMNITVINPVASTSPVVSVPAIVQTPAPTSVSATTTAPVSAPVATAKKYLFTRNLIVGSRGAAVVELQKRLTTLGFYAGPVSGSFGPLTAAGVKKFQVAHGLARVGTVGPATRAALNKN